MIPSAVNIQQLAKPAVTIKPDQRGGYAAAAQLVGQGVRIYKEHKANKIADSITNPQASHAPQNQSAGQESQPITPEQEADQLQAQQVELQEKQQIMTAQQTAQKNREAIAQNGWVKDMINDPEKSAQFAKLQKYDEGMAKTVLDTLKTRDAYQAQEIAVAAKQANDMYTNYGVLLNNHGKDVADNYILEQARGIHSKGGDVSKIMSLRNMQADDAAAYSDTMRAATGTVLEIKEVADATVTLAEGAQLYNKNGNLIAENEKDVAEMTEYQRKTLEIREREAQQGIDLGGSISAPSPKDFTTQSIAKYQKTGDAADLERFHSASDKRAQVVIDDGLAASQTIPVLKRSLELLDSVNTGGHAAAAIKAKQMFGIESADEAELSNKLGVAVISQYRETFGAAFTEREGNKLDSISASLGKSVAGNKRVINQVLTLAEQKVKNGRARAESLGDTMSIDEMDGYINMDLGAANQDNSAILAEAEAAISAGADRTAVMSRLKEMGIE